jgi:hypothetical protein
MILNLIKWIKITKTQSNINSSINTNNNPLTNNIIKIDIMININKNTNHLLKIISEFVFSNGILIRSSNMTMIDHEMIGNLMYLTT